MAIVNYSLIVSDPWLVWVPEFPDPEPMEGGEAIAVPADVPGNRLGGGELHVDHIRRQADWRPSATLLIEDE